MKTKVIFRKYLSPNKNIGLEIIALFPEIPHNDSLITSYAHVGQHGSADYNYCIQKTKPATRQEYKDLYNELVNVVGYELQIIKRYTRRA